MGFRGYWFNNSGTYRTNKYPHCYVGIVKPSGALWGGFGKYDEQQELAMVALVSMTEQLDLCLVVLVSMMEQLDLFAVHLEVI